MLIQLSIRDIVLIDRLDLAFEPGLSVLTGETGAGKSILLDSLSLALGGRGDGGLVRHGEDKGQVTAVFDVALSHPLRGLLQENAIDEDGENIIFRRVQSADGRTRAWPEWRDWLGRRAAAGKMFPKGFPATKRFRPR